ncbi:MAG TPA: OsmC family peroxiredoxin [Aestuariivirgaceae bacterium]|jgi:osmotically inducible protein OsmC
MPVRSSKAEWHGSLREGHGHMSFGNGAFDGEFSFGSRFESGVGTNPEELIAAAHAGCFSMQLSGLLTKDGHPPKRISTRAKVKLDLGQHGADISLIELETEGEVPGIDAATFAKTAEQAKEICPVSKALKAVKTTVKATLR